MKLRLPKKDFRDRLLLNSRKGANKPPINNMPHYDQREFERQVRDGQAKKKQQDEALALAKAREIETRLKSGFETSSTEEGDEDFSPEVEAAMAAGYATIQSARTSTKKA